VTQDDAIDFLNKTKSSSFQCSEAVKEIC